MYRVLSRSQIGMIACAGMLLSCGSALEKVQARAPFDLDCPADKIEYTELDSDVVGAKGCGKRATYVVPCNLYGECGAARMNSAGENQKRE